MRSGCRSVHGSGCHRAGRARRAGNGRRRTAWSSRGATGPGRDLPAPTAAQTGRAWAAPGHSRQQRVATANVVNALASDGTPARLLREPLPGEKTRPAGPGSRRRPSLAAPALWHRAVKFAMLSAADRRAYTRKRAQTRHRHRGGPGSPSRRMQRHGAAGTRDTDGIPIVVVRMRRDETVYAGWTASVNKGDVSRGQPSAERSADWHFEFARGDSVDPEAYWNQVGSHWPASAHAGVSSVEHPAASDESDALNDVRHLEEKRVALRDWQNAGLGRKRFRTRCDGPARCPMQTEKAASAYLARQGGSKQRQVRAVPCPRAARVAALGPPVANNRRGYAGPTLRVAPKNCSRSQRDY